MKGKLCKTWEDSSFRFPYPNTLSRLLVNVHVWVFEAIWLILLQFNYLIDFGVWIEWSQAFLANVQSMQDDHITGRELASK